MFQLIKDGNVIHVGTACNDGGAISNVIYEQGLPKSDDYIILGEEQE